MDIFCAELLFVCFRRSFKYNISFAVLYAYCTFQRHMLILRLSTHTGPASPMNPTDCSIVGPLVEPGIYNW